MIDGLLQVQEDASRFAMTRDTYLRMVENSILADLDAAIVGATPAEVVAHIEAAAERMGAMGA